MFPIHILLLLFNQKIDELPSKAEERVQKVIVYILCVFLLIVAAYFATRRSNDGTNYIIIGWIYWTTMIPIIISIGFAIRAISQSQSNVHLAGTIMIRGLILSVLMLSAFFLIDSLYIIIFKSSSN